MNEGLTTAPTVIGNTVYVTSTLGNTTYALTSDTGHLVWTYQTGGNIYSSPAVVDGAAYFGSYDGNLYAVGQAANSSGTGTSNTIYYIAAIAILIVIIVVAIIVLRKRR
jgi:outer membrane protein assembly factor BamB